MVSTVSVVQTAMPTETRNLCDGTYMESTRPDGMTDAAWKELKDYYESNPDEAHNQKNIADLAAEAPARDMRPITPAPKARKQYAPGSVSLGELEPMEVDGKDEIT